MESIVLWLNLIGFIKFIEPVNVFLSSPICKTIMYCYLAFFSVRWAYNKAVVGLNDKSVGVHHKKANRSNKQSNFSYNSIVSSFRRFFSTLFSFETGNKYYYQLLRACVGDRAKAKRLITYELERYPNITYKEACKRAFETLMYDRRSML